MRTQFCGNIFLGIWFPQNLGYFRISQAEEEGSGEESSACSIRFILAKFGADKNTNTSYHKIVSAFLSLYGCPNLKGMHPRHPPRAFPLWLLAPRCLCADSSPRFLGRGSLLSPGRAIYSESTRSTPSPSPLYVLYIYACGVAFASKLL
jgi:hypothetical protein